MQFINRPIGWYGNDQMNKKNIFMFKTKILASGFFVFVIASLEQLGGENDSNTHQFSKRATTQGMCGANDGFPSQMGDPEKMGIHRNPSGNNHVMLTWFVVEPTYLKNMRKSKWESSPNRVEN